jgi:hypothetical protein
MSTGRLLDEHENGRSAANEESILTAIFERGTERSEDKLATEVAQAPEHRGDRDWIRALAAGRNTTGSPCSAALLPTAVIEW